MPFFASAIAKRTPFSDFLGKKGKSAEPLSVDEDTLITEQEPAITPESDEEGLEQTISQEEDTQPPPIDLSEYEPVSLYDAARNLDLSIDELKNRFRKGIYRGFVRNGELFIYIRASEIAEANEDQSNTVEPDSQPTSGATLGQGLHTVVEFQKIEINRLIRANKEIKAEKDRLYLFLEREQVLRQGLQRTIDRVSARLDALAELEKIECDSAVKLSSPSEKES
jgi:hypothetical protein